MRSATQVAPARLQAGTRKPYCAAAPSRRPTAVTSLQFRVPAAEPTPPQRVGTARQLIRPTPLRKARPASHFLPLQSPIATRAHWGQSRSRRGRERSITREPLLRLLVPAPHTTTRRQFREARL